MELLNIKKNGFIPFLFAMSLVALGIFHEYLSCVFSVVLLVWMFWKIKKEKKLKFYINIASISIIVIVLGYLISVLWALDKGMAFVGFLKFLPILLFLLALAQEKKSKEVIQKSLPYVAAIITVLSIIGMQIPYVSSFFSVSGRLAGFFQYPNTFALFLLVSELILVEKVKYTKFDYGILGILFAGILYTGSRTVFVLAVLANLVWILSSNREKVKRILPIGIFAVLVVLIYVWLGPGVQVIDRFLKISLSESTFLGRILYFQDALPVILKNPLGLGYMGYYYLQRSIQTGVYSVLYIHNDFLQIMLDIGWLPCLLLVISFFKVIFAKNTSNNTKIILGVMFLHGCFDFDLQFMAMFCLLILFLEIDAGREIIIKRNIITFKIAIVGVTLICTICGLSLLLTHVGKYETAHIFYQWNTQNEIAILADETDLEKADKIADEVLKQNEYAAISYSVKARYAYMQGDFESLIKYKNLIFDLAPFQYEEYEEYCYMLINGISLYKASGDFYSANVCEKELMEARNRLSNLEDRLSVLGTKIVEQPQVELPEEIEQYIRTLSNEEK